MSDNRRYVQAQTFILSGSGAIVGATTIVLSSMKQIDGSTNLTSTDIGSKATGTLEPNNSTQEEAITFTGITQNSNGTATLTGVKTVLFVDPYTETSGLAKAHPGGAKFILTNTAEFYSEFTNKNDDETISGNWIFPSDNTNNAGIVADTDTTMATAFVTFGQLSRQAISGASNASTTVKGIVQLPTQAQVDAKTTTGSTGALLGITPDVMRSTLLSDYVADTGTSTAYAIAPSPAITAYTIGQRFVFKAKNSNSFISGSTPTLAVSGLTAQSLRAGKANLRREYIRTNWMVGVIYDGGGFEIESASAQVPISQDSNEIYGVSSTGNTAYVVALVPAVSKYTAGMVVTFKPDTGGGHSTVNINSLGARGINRPVNGVMGPVLTGDVIANQDLTIVYNDTAGAFQMVNPPSTLNNTNVNTSNIIASSGTPISISGSSITTEQTVFSVTVPGNTLGTTGAIESTLFVTGLNFNSGTFTMNLYYGTTVIATWNGTKTNSLTPVGFLKLRVMASGATNSQRGSLYLHCGTAASNADIANFVNQLQTGTAAIDSTLSQVYKLTVTWSSTDASNTFNIDGYVVNKL